MWFIFLCVLCGLYALWTWRLRTIRSLHEPPFYPGLYPFIGHTYMLSGGPKELWTLVSNVAMECSKKGGVIRVVLGLQQYYLITDPEDALTAANGCLKKHFAYNWAKPWLGNGLVTASGPNWKRHRQIIVRAFSLPVLHGFLGVFNSQARILNDHLSAKAGAGRFDILPFVADNTLQTICMTAFGIDPLDDGHIVKKYKHAVDTILGLIVEKFCNLWMHSDFICKLVGSRQKEDEIIGILNNMSDISDDLEPERDSILASIYIKLSRAPSFVNTHRNADIIQKKRDALNKKEQSVNDESTNLQGSRYKSLLELLLELSENNDLSDKEIREEVDTFIVAGYDSTALAISYTLMNLGIYPEIQDRVYKEIQSVFGNTDRDLDKTDFSQLLYTEAVLKETLRVYPIGPVLLRYADKDVQLKNYKIRAGSNVALLINGMNRHPVWGADADIFRPERWLKLTAEQNNAYGSFSLGKRICLGQHFALMSVKTTLIHILRRYRVIADSSDLRFRVDFILKPVSGCNVILERRN